MKFKILLTGIICFFALNKIYSQWPVIYGDSVNTVTRSVFEHYDKGYVISGERYLPGYTVYGWLLKTDINGNERWSKCLGDQQKITRIFSSKPTSDGGIIEGGLYKISSKGCSDPLIIKLNVCGEKKWCKTYNAPHCYSTCYDICNTNNEGYMALMDHWKSGEEETIWLFKLDSLGEVIWAQIYATDPTFFSEWSHSLIKTTDSCFIITGEAYYPDPTYPYKKIIKILLIKVDQNGDVIFEVPWGTSNGVYSKGYQTIEDSMHVLYTSGEHPRTTSPGGDSPCIFKTSPFGDPISYYDLLDTTVKGVSTSINWLQDSTIVTGVKWGYNFGVDTIGAIKSDRNGIIYNKKSLLTEASGTLNDGDITFNNRIILTGSFYFSNYWQTFAFKLNSDLDYDSIYTSPFTYDSLCPYPIVSDTIPLDDCDVVVVGIDEAIQHPETIKLHAYPNPTDTKITIEMPKYLVRKSAGNGITATTTYHQWKEVRLEVFDLFGRLMYSEMIPQSKKIVEMDLASWPPGMYVARIVFMNEVAGSVKFVVN